MKLTTILLAALSAKADIVLTWQHPDTTAMYIVQRAAGACSPTSAFAPVGRVELKTFHDAPTTGTYCYRVIAVVGGVESAPSDPISHTVAPPAPTGLKIAAAP